MVNNYPISVPKIFGTVVEAVEPIVLPVIQGTWPGITNLNYIYGNWKEVSLRMQNMAIDSIRKSERFPVVLLIEDITVSRPSTSNGLFGTATNMNVVIATATQKDYSSEQREEKTFAPILRPIYWELLTQLVKSAAFNVTTERKIGHNYIERKYWGLENHSKNAMTEFIDAIDITNLDLPINWAYCNKIINENIV